MKTIDDLLEAIVKSYPYKGAKKLLLRIFNPVGEHIFSESVYSNMTDYVPTKRITLYYFVVVLTDGETVVKKKDVINTLPSTGETKINIAKIWSPYDYMVTVRITEIKGNLDIGKTFTELRDLREEFDIPIRGQVHISFWKTETLFNWKVSKYFNITDDIARFKATPEMIEEYEKKEMQAQRM